MPTLNIEGVGRVKVSDEFLKLSPYDQQAQADEIASTVQATKSKGVAKDISAMSAGEVAKEAASNLGPDALKVGQEMAGGVKAIATHPVDTAVGAVNSIADIGTGIIEHFADKLGIKLGTGEYAKKAEAVGQSFMDAYGSVDAIKKSIATRPAHVLMDLSAVLSGGGGALVKAPGVLGRVGEVAAAADPLAIAGKGVKAAAGVVAPGGGAERAALSGAGVDMTPGQMIGGVFKNLEDAATSVPVLGDFINSGRRRSVETFNEAVANQALAPIGEKLSRGVEAGHDAVDEVATKLGKAYDKIEKKLTWAPDQQFIAEVNNLRNGSASTLPDATAKQFDKTITHVMRGSFAPMNGKLFKGVESELTQKIKNYSSSSLATERDLGGALQDYLKSMRGALERSNPAQAKELSAINSGWAMYSRIRAAASRRATSGGVFTPADLLAAVKSGDKSVGKGSFARGDALMQTFAEAGQKVLPSTLPDSGTAKRLMSAGGLAGASYALSNPLILAVGAAAVAPYTRLGMSALNAGKRGKLPARLLGQTAFQTGRQQNQ